MMMMPEETRLSYAILPESKGLSIGEPGGGSWTINFSSLKTWSYFPWHYIIISLYY